MPNGGCDSGTVIQGEYVSTGNLAPGMTATTYQREDPPCPLLQARIVEGTSIGVPRPPPLPISHDGEPLIRTDTEMDVLFRAGMDETQEERNTQGKISALFSPGEIFFPDPLPMYDHVAMRGGNGTTSRQLGIGKLGPLYQHLPSAHGDVFGAGGPPCLPDAGALDTLHPPELHARGDVIGPVSPPWLPDAGALHPLYHLQLHARGDVIGAGGPLWLPGAGAQDSFDRGCEVCTARRSSLYKPFITAQGARGSAEVNPWHASRSLSSTGRAAFGSARDATDTLGRPWTTPASLSPPILHVPQLPYSVLTPTPPITPIMPSPIVQPRNANPPMHAPPALHTEDWHCLDAMLPEPGDANYHGREFPLYSYREELIKGRRWPLYVKQVNGSGASGTMILNKGHHSDYHGRSEFTFTVSEARRLTLPSTSLYYTTTRASESVAGIARKHRLSARDLVNMNLRLENISVSSKFKVGTHLCVASIVD